MMRRQIMGAVGTVTAGLLLRTSGCGAGTRTHLSAEARRRGPLPGKSHLGRWGVTG
jgi:hypothetical protein